jgi:serine protease AprX
VYTLKAKNKDVDVNPTGLHSYVDIGIGIKMSNRFGQWSAWRNCALAVWTCVALLATGLPWSAQAYSSAVQAKIAPDLQTVTLQGQFEKNTYNWLKKDKGQWLVKVLVVSNNDEDAQARELRSAILSAGGSVLYRYLSVNAVLAILPAQQVINIAHRSDVESISPNRLATQSASFEEQVTGAATLRARAGSMGLDGRGVGIALLDSGIMREHINFLDVQGNARVLGQVSFTRLDDGPAKTNYKKWIVGVDYSDALAPGSKGREQYEKTIGWDKSKEQDDEFGHGTFVAGVAAGLGRATNIDSTGVAPGAMLYDLKVLNEQGVGQIGDVLAAIDWVIYYHKIYGIRVINLSLAADSTESYLTDPLCRAVRAAVANGITVVVAAGNYGKDEQGREVYGSIASPGNEPSAITVGAVRSAGTLIRTDDKINTFSSRGPTRGGDLNSNGERVPDNLLKPDLVAPGNNVVSAESSAQSNRRGGSALADENPGLRLGRESRGDRGVMFLSGTSVAAPAVAGTVALMLQANPGLTPPLIKAALQYSAQPLGNASLVQQGAGQLNVEGAVRIALALRTDIAWAIKAGRIQVGDSLLAAGKSLPPPSSLLNDEPVAWSQLVFAGGSYVLGGAPLLAQYQAFYDPRLLWVRERVRRYAVVAWPTPVDSSGEPLHFRYMREAAPYTGSLSSVKLISADQLAGFSNAAQLTGVFTPTSTLANGLAQGAGKVLSESLSVNRGQVQSALSGVLGTGVIFQDGQNTSVGKVLAEGLTVGSSKIMSEAGQVRLQRPANNSVFGER